MLVSILVLVAVALLVWHGEDLPVGGAVADHGSGDDVAREIGRSFLEDYVDEQGRVIRRDEGGDVVSEGQAYGMLIAAAIGDSASFRRIWSWTKANLIRPDGLLAWRWQHGSVDDPNSASDADVDAARALALAGRRFDADELTSDGELLAAAVLRYETVPIDVGPVGTAVPLPAGDGLVLVAGSWATSAPQEVNPSYFNPRGERDLSKLTSDRRWTTLSSTHRVIIDHLLTIAALPPDWFDLDGGSVTPTGHDSAPIQFGLDAARIPIRLAESCEPQDQQLAASMRATLDNPPSPAGIRNVNGGAASEWKHPVALVAAAATDHAAGDDEAVAEKLRAATELEHQYPSYYGAAWVALGRLMLQTTLLGDCAD